MDGYQLHFWFRVVQCRYGVRDPFDQQNSIALVLCPVLINLPTTAIIMELTILFYSVTKYHLRAMINECW